MPLDVRPIAPTDLLTWVTERSGSFLQLPSWGGVKAEWGHEHLGWFDGDRMVGAGLVLLRRMPVLPRSLAYLPEGPVVDWSAYRVRDVTGPLLAHLRGRGAFAVKMGPQVEVRRWHAATLKDAIAAGSARRLTDVPADETNAAGLALAEQLRAAGWQQHAGDDAGFGDVQPRYVFQLPLADRSVDDLRAGLNQLWRRNVKKAEKSRVEVGTGGYDDLADFHRVYVETAHRDGFTPRPLGYFQRMWRSLRAEDEDRIRLYLARRDGDLLAATTWVRSGGHVWYSYGASTTAGREHRPSNAVQWRMLTDAQRTGARVYDLRGISATLDPADPLFGLIQFKLGTGGDAVEHVGEWDYPLSATLHRGFRWYLSRR